MSLVLLVAGLPVPPRRHAACLLAAGRPGDRCCGAEGAEADAKRQFRTAFAPCPGEGKRATGLERFEIPRVPGAEAVEIRHKVHGDVFDNTTIVFTKGGFVYAEPSPRRTGASNAPDRWRCSIMPGTAIE